MRRAGCAVLSSGLRSENVDLDVINEVKYCHWEIPRCMLFSSSPCVHFRSHVDRCLFQPSVIKVFHKVCTNIDEALPDVNLAYPWVTFHCVAYFHAQGGELLLVSSLVEPKLAS